MCPFGKHARAFFEMLQDYTKRTFLFHEKCVEEDDNNHVVKNKQGLLNHCKARKDWKHDMILFFFNELYKPKIVKRTQATQKSNRNKRHRRTR